MRAAIGGVTLKHPAACRGRRLLYVSLPLQAFHGQVATQAHVAHAAPPIHTRSSCMLPVASDAAHALCLCTCAPAPAHIKTRMELQTRYGSWRASSAGQIRASAGSWRQKTAEPHALRSGNAALDLSDRRGPLPIHHAKQVDLRGDPRRCPAETCPSLMACQKWTVYRT
jgi:hypothetical protein